VQVKISEQAIVEMKDTLCVGFGLLCEQRPQQQQQQDLTLARQDDNQRLSNEKQSE